MYSKGVVEIAADKSKLYSCPVCRLPLEKQERCYVCPNQHSFDIAKKGYVNLLLANQKNAKEPGDSKEMIISRRDFLNKGYYEPLAEQLSKIIIKLIGIDKKDEINLLDAGCGEGYFTSRIKKQLIIQNPTCNVTLWGIDISKPAINFATGRDKEINFAIASNYNLPILSESLDCILWTFAPGEEAEFRRVLKKSGKLITVTPGYEHLFGLKEMLYDQARKHEIKDTVPDGFKFLESISITYELCLKDSGDIVNLLAMTPYYWHINSTARQKVESADELQTSVDFLIKIYEKI